MYSNELIRGTLKTIILKLLSENEKMYGYELSRVVKEQTESKIILTEGALYPILHKLEKDKLVTVSFEKIGNRTRKYYSLTVEGKSTSKAKRSELLDFIQTLSTFMKVKSSMQ